MFDRFIRFARIRRALAEQRYEDALQMAADPVVGADRRAEQLRQQAAAALVKRARGHLLAGELDLAQRCAAGLQVVSQLAEVGALQHDLEQAAGTRAAIVAASSEAVTRVRADLHAGRLDLVEAALPGCGDGAEARQLRARALEQRQQAERLLAEPLPTDGGSWHAAAEALARAEALDRTGAAVAKRRRELSALSERSLEATVQELLLDGDVLGAFARVRADLALLPSLRQSPAGLAVAARLERALRVALVEATDLAVAVPLARAALEAGLEPSPSLAPLLDALLGVVPWVEAPLAMTEGRAAERAAAGAAIVAAAEPLRAQGLVAAVAPWLREAAAAAERLAAARALLEAGDLDAARALLVAFLAEQPLHPGARAELDVVDAGLAELDRRLGEARAALRAAKLRSACGLLLAIAGSGRVVAQAQELLVEARARMALVERGLDEVRVALHGRAAATQEGVRHCLLRLEELAKVQADHEDLPAVLAAVQVELDALRAVEQLTGSLADGRLHAALPAFAEVLALRPRLLRPDRLDARLVDLADAAARRVEASLAQGRLDEVAQAVAGFAPLVALRADYGERAAAWSAQVAERRARAEGHLAAARQSLRERDLAEAERLADAADQAWTDGGPVRSFQAELAGMRHQLASLERVGELLAEGDVAGAEHKLQTVPQTAPLLRTRVFDMKQEVARAQGLDGAFVLRVDEGGEHLVLRGETVTLGNLRQRRADVPLLANLAGCHASIRRSMSFHGGMQDTIHREEGSVVVQGRAVEQHRLGSGDRVQLGPLGLGYRLPSNRSATAALTLLGGFQVAGTDRLLLMKDRGRDGRILVGSGKDAHVRVARATGEVEIFANPSGQMRVACAQGGTIDGVPWKGEHPIGAGQVVVAAGVTLLLLPWRAG